MENKIKKITVENAIEHGGKSAVNSVLGKLISEDPSIKKDIKKTIPVIKKIVDEINSLSLDEQKAMAKKFGLKKKEKVKEEIGVLPDLPGAKKRRVTTAFPPEPSKYPHLGHAKSALVNFEYAKKYEGKFVLRFEDSNPEIARKEYYEALLDGMKWLGLKWDTLDYLSDHMDEYYKSVQKLIKQDNAYVCSCAQEDVKASRSEGKACACRKLSPKENLERWNSMLTDAEKGSFILRMKIDLEHVNTAMRDPTIARINDTPHVRTKKKYRVWPNYDLGTSMLDGWEKVTHRVRTKEFELRKELQDYILDKLKMKTPHIVEIGRFQIKDSITQGRDIREGIENKTYSGWDDPRLSTLASLRRRGFSPEGLKEFLLSTGVTKTESVYEWQVIEAFNKKVIDPVSDRYFGVLNPVKIKIVSLPKENVTIAMRPGSEKTRDIPIASEEVYIDKEDNQDLKDNKVGLMFLCTANFGPVIRFVSKEIAQETPKLHWVGSKNVSFKLVMPDGSVKKGIGEPALSKLKKDQTIQLYRIGFCRVDVAGKEPTLYFAHK